MVKTVAVKMVARDGEIWWKWGITATESLRLMREGAFETWRAVRAAYAGDNADLRGHIDNLNVDLGMFFEIDGWGSVRRSVFDVFCALCCGSAEQEALAIEVAKRMIAAGIDVRAPRYFGQTMLMTAAIFRRKNVVAYLLPFSDAEAKNPQGADALRIAEERGAEDIAGMIRTHIEREELRALDLPAVDDVKPEDDQSEESRTGMKRDTL